MQKWVERRLLEIAGTFRQRIMANKHLKNKSCEGVTTILACESLTLKPEGGDESLVRAVSAWLGL